MPRQILNVPPDKCFLDALAEMGEKIRNTGLFIHFRFVEKSKNDPSCNWVQTGSTITFSWEATEEYPKTVITLTKAEGIPYYEAISISAVDICFTEKVQSPNFLLFVC